MRKISAFLFACASFGPSLAGAQSASLPLHKGTALPPPSITGEQRQRLDQKLLLIEQIVRSVEGDLKAADPAADSRRWLLESLLPLSLEQIRAVGMPGTLAATSDAILKLAQRPEIKALGNPSADLTYTPFAPCRYIDTRNVGGKIAGSRTFDVSKAGNAFGGSAACIPTTLSGASAPEDIAALAINITVVDTSTAAAPGFATVRPAGSTAVSALVNWTTSTPGFQLGNAAVVTSSQAATNEIEVLTSGAVHAIVDVFGAFLRPGATLLDCTDSGNATATIAAGANASVTTPACSTDRFPVGGECTADAPIVNLVSSYLTGVLQQGSSWGCAYHNYGGASATIHAYQVCCKVPGR